MKYCPITYDEISDNETYSRRGLKLLAPTLENLQPLPIDAAEQRAKAIANAGKMSIQGVQPKLSAQLKIKDSCFELVEQYGHYILKPPSDYFPELPANEAITMTLAAHIGIDIPVHGLVYAKDRSLTYFVKRFDRKSHREKIATEDFAQLSQLTRETKYNSTMEKVAKIITDYCSFPKIEAVKLFKLTLFSFLVGNEDMHLKNFSLITSNQKIQLSPAYDLLSTTIAQIETSEELALSLNGKKRNLRRKDFIEYFGLQYLQLNTATIQQVLREIEKALPTWQMLIHRSFLSKPMQEKYLALLNERYQQLEFKKI